LRACAPGFHAAFVYRFGRWALDVLYRLMYLVSRCRGTP